MTAAIKINSSFDARRFALAPSSFPGHCTLRTTAREFDATRVATYQIQKMSTASSRATDRAYIADTDSQILSLDEQPIQVLEFEKLRAQKQLNLYAYPVLTLPNEIVSEIFIQFLPVYPSPPPMSGPLSPTFLSHIETSCPIHAHALESDLIAGSGLLLR
ncbi:hypothetical protein DFH08DRAFT_941591 [Mycena albidolilacea]|uniref:Uncharacterized protein n=1 Tax=Mycena albidolilacea TaxID=1033008 RepID=A0AAD6ZHE4_9AGAR|nr:hypothetical protein DFH08DRAFT_941591 [Mycena albidolilacea]